MGAISFPPVTERIEKEGYIRKVGNKQQKCKPGKYAVVFIWRTMMFDLLTHLYIFLLPLFIYFFIVFKLFWGGGGLNCMGTCPKAKNKNE